MSTTISTWELNKLTVSSALNVQSQLGQAEVQESSGLVAQDFGTLGGSNATETLNLESQIAQAQSWSADATTVGNTTQPMYSAIGSMATIVSNLQSQISGALASPTPSSIVPQVQTLMTTLAGEMNTQVAGQYVFAGGNRFGVGFFVLFFHFDLDNLRTIGGCISRCQSRNFNFLLLRLARYDFL